MAKRLGRGLSSLLGILDDEPELKSMTKNSAKQNDSIMQDDGAKQSNSINTKDELTKNNQMLNKNNGVSDNNYMLSDNNYINNGKIIKNDTNNLNGVIDIDMQLIDNNPNQPRKNFDANALQELATSIKNYGIIQPIVLKPIGSRYLIIAGERRFRASKLAGLKKVPAVIRDYNEIQIREIALLENIQREDLNAIETASAMKELLNDYKWSQDELADKLGKSRPAVSNTLRLLSLCQEVQDLVRSGKLSAGHARCLVMVSNKEIQIKLANMAITKKITVRDMENAIKNITKPSHEINKVNKSVEIKEFENNLQHKFSTKVNIKGDDKKGKIIINYYNQEDLDRIYFLIDKIK